MHVLRLFPINRSHTVKGALKESFARNRTVPSGSLTVGVVESAVSERTDISVGVATRSGLSPGSRPHNQ